MKWSHTLFNFQFKLEHMIHSTTSYQLSRTTVTLRSHFLQNKWETKFNCFRLSDWKTTPLCKAIHFRNWLVPTLRLMSSVQFYFLLRILLFKYFRLSYFFSIKSSRKKRFGCDKKLNKNSDIRKQIHKINSTHSFRMRSTASFIN